ncbi:MAG: nitronate monooxygenase [Rhodococcus sp. (in: high G+C Gram-positive bacteria)]|nr:nitronate monooxygenase [Rhodococcus sp. (in: high G+C Gram-positive bacteria)]
MLPTRLTDLLECEHPVMLAGMGGVAYADLVVAVSEAGGFGTLGAAPMPFDRMTAEIAEIRQRTNRPFGVDLLTALPGDMETQVEAIIAGGASLFVAGLGVPRQVIDLCHEHGVLVASMCGRVRHAVAAVEAGCDIVIAQGTEAGGHTGLVATMPLVPQVVDAVGGRVPVVAAGGIFDGRGLAAALMLGADGVWVGTRFIAAPEAHVVGGYREALVAGREDDTVITRAYTGKTLRALRNDYTQFFDDHPDELQRFPDQIGRSLGDGAMHLGAPPDASGVDPAKECYAAGQGVGAVTEVTPAGEIVREFVAEAERCLAHAAELVARRS